MAGNQNQNNRKRNGKNNNNTVKGAVDAAKAETQPTEEELAQQKAAADAEAAKQAEEARLAEEKRIADEKAAEEAKKQEEAKKAQAIKVEQERVRIEGVKKNFDLIIEKYRACCKPKTMTEAGLKNKVNIFAELVLYVIKTNESAIFDQTVEFFREEKKGLMAESTVFGGIGHLGAASRTKVEVFYSLISKITRSNGPVKINADYIREVLGNDVIGFAAKYLDK